MTIRCEECDRTYKSNSALQQHLRDSSVHTSTFECEHCQRTFSSEQALQQHRESPAHRMTFHCDSCDQDFNNKQALLQHMRDSPAHSQTPLDAFFTSFDTFPYDRGLPPSESFFSLKRHQGWRRGDEESEDAWRRYQDAIRAELELWYGAEDDLVAWHTLCRAIGIQPPPSSCDSCLRVSFCPVFVLRPEKANVALGRPEYACKHR